MMAKPTKTLELHYPMIQCLIISDFLQFWLGTIRSRDTLDQSHASEKIWWIVSKVIYKSCVNNSLQSPYWEHCLQNGNLT